MSTVTEQPLVRAFWRFVLLRSAWRRSFAMEPPRALILESPQEPEAPQRVDETRMEEGQHCCCRP
jgi:hypothetical protein